ncbi:MAG TPA: gluconate 2-dehydrogenase subunit 3 family protein [Vicinamibacteria bacterium]|nr:gluconate 2-dehydrogenase subunit 3 family protein [Vicinamibacteria bacterium]
MTSHNASLDLLTRREAIRRVSVLFGGTALVAQARFLDALESSSPPAAAYLTSIEVTLLDEVAETMLPETSTPGAKAAGVGRFMDLMVADAYDPDERRIFREGLRTLDGECTEMNGRDFMAATPAERLSLLERLDREQYEYMQEWKDGEPVHYFRMMKELALLGYFTSEIGYTKALRFVETPGRFEPCVPYAPGDKAWAPHA